MSCQSGSMKHTTRPCLVSTQQLLGQKYQVSFQYRKAAMPMQTFKEADLAGDGHISPEEWQILVKKHPNMINYMTLPVLKELTKKYPSFVFNENRK